MYFNYSFFFFKQKTAYEMRISDWSSDVCSSDLDRRAADGVHRTLFVDRLANDVEDAAERLRAAGHRYLRAGVGDGLAPGQAVGRVHRDREDGVLAEVLRALEPETFAVVHVFDRVHNPGELAGELGVDAGTGGP